MCVPVLVAKKQRSHTPKGAIMKKLGMALCTALGMATMMMPAFPQTAAEQGKEQAIVTVLPQNEKAKYVDISAQDLDLRINGKDADITDWVSLQGPLDKLELVVLIDDSARVSLGRQLGDCLSTQRPRSAI
jgi:hypothetical protein